ncbi:MAG: TGS domain-containing protein, partial [Pseudomonadota bacterium]
MPRITLPDGSVRAFDAPISGADLAASIGAGLAKAAIAVLINGTEQDLSTLITEDATVSILTLKDPQGLDIARHTLTAQLLARAIKIRFPTAKLAIGPTIENGFYYDIDFEESISSDLLPTLEADMLAIAKENNPVQRELWDAHKVRDYFVERGETYKADIIDSAIAKGDVLPNNQLSVYRQVLPNGDFFLDLCRGPHTSRTGLIPPAF